MDLRELIKDLKLILGCFR